MAGAQDPGEGMFLSTVAPGHAQRLLARAIILISAVIFVAVAPFAQVQLPQIWAFIPIYQSVTVINDLITAILLFGQFGILRSPALLALASGYLFTALIAAVHTLTFPGLFAPSGLLGAGPQSTAWLYMFWHGGFPIAVIAYVLLDKRRHDSARPLGRPGIAITICVAAVIVAICALALLVTVAHDALPAIMQGNRYTPAMAGTVTTAWISGLMALVMLWWRRRRSVLDQWMTVVMCAWLFDIALAAMLNAGRFDLGFYAGRIYGLLASSLVLLALLLENGVLYARLARALEGERNERSLVEEKTAELNDLNDSLERRVAARTAELDALNRELHDEVRERKRAESDALEVRQTLAGVIDSAMDAIITVDEQQQVVLFNTTAESLFGCPQSEALGAPLARFIPERFHASHAEHVRRFGMEPVRSRRMATQRLVHGLRSSGEEFPIDASISKVSMRGRMYYTVILRDVTERLRAEEELRRSKDELHEIASVGATAREQEKMRVARELHDELAQALTMLNMDLTWLRGRAFSGDEACATKIAAMQKLLAGTIAATRRIAADLRPLVLDDLGLVPAAEWLVEKFRERYGIDCGITIVPRDLDLSDPHATAVFRIMQESLVNVARHAGASRVDVDLRYDDGEIRLQVRDDGRGFDPTSPRKANSFGLVGLRERAHLVDGVIAIDAAPGRGTRIEVRIPLPREPRAP